MSEPTTHSISFRLRRTTIEEAFVSVPVTEEILQTTPDEDGYRHIDPEKAVKVALDLGRNAETHWITEAEPEITLHPLQTEPSRLQ